MSLIVVLTALPARLAAIRYNELSPHWTVVVNLLAGSLLGADAPQPTVRDPHGARVRRWDRDGGVLAGLVPEGALIPLPGALLLYRAVKVWRHATPASE
jgi:hypothetical protein